MVEALHGDQSLENLIYEGKLKELEFSPWKREGLGGNRISVLKGQSQRGWRLSLHEDPHGDDNV